MTLDSIRALAGFRIVEARGSIAVVDAELAAAVEACGLLRAEGAERRLDEAAGTSGRAPTAVVSLPQRTEQIVLRPVLHGGLLGPCLGRAMLGVSRPLRELLATHRLRQAGAPVPRPALVVAQRRLAPVWHGIVGTVRIEDSSDAETFLRSAPGPRRVEEVAGVAGSAVRCLHDAGGRHADLHIKNLLVRARPVPQVFVIDLDRARVLPQVKVAERMRELMRLYRSLHKRGLFEIVGVRGCAAFLRAYVDGDRGLRLALLARLPHERMRVALHALGYSLRRRSRPRAA